MESLTELAKLGLSGICVALIILIGYIIRLVFSHIKENTQVTQGLKDVVRELKDYLTKQNGRK